MMRELFCTREETILAYKLGAPIVTDDHVGGCHLMQPDRYTVNNDNDESLPMLLCNPTLEQMITWLREEHKIYVSIVPNIVKGTNFNGGFKASFWTVYDGEVKSYEGCSYEDAVYKLLDDLLDRVYNLQKRNLVNEILKGIN